MLSKNVAFMHYAVALTKTKCFFFKMIFFSILNQLVLNCQMITSKMQMQFALFQKLSINFNFDWY